ncbi:hydrogenase large subunit [Rhodococcus opacus]|uniref:hydrogenase large subunit n=1 Tax=Rhodococcus opacus TaxID=37919 RepID=UPI0002A32C81|nr:NADH-quinone oxidoreductase subunit C [Rhodococcus opacus]ELB86593.1 NADH dehydrogenase subunit C [Rhodococcus wratislaviensis IFP 2016]MDV6247782.1 NADH-quinone oxidoreductase subunit C [Rhodococcus opacus]WKN59862.1 NADH-quinone oxidoreductase subunit C [Rhodococcus opacus]
MTGNTPESFPMDLRSNRGTRAVTADELTLVTETLLQQGFRLALVAAHEDADEFRIVYLFTAGQPDRRIEVVLRTGKTTPVIPTLAASSFPAGRFEREIRDLYGITPEHHPLARRLVRHQHWPQGWYPMRADAGSPPDFASPDEPYPFVTVGGPGVYEIPVGPVHAGLIEPGHFRLSVVGETILKLKVRLWFTHKGIEKLAEGRNPEDGLPLAERISGDTTIGHSLAYCLAIEDTAQWEVPTPAVILRAILLELERIYNHVGTLGGLCNDVGYAIVNSHAMRVREQLLRLGAEMTGHRLMRGAVFPGGAQVRTLPDRRRMAAIAADIDAITDLALRNSIVRDRFTGTAVLPTQSVRDLGALGPVARASGVDPDARRDHPFLPETAGVGAATQTAGDVMARFLVRAEEVTHSIELLQHLLPMATPGVYAGPRPSLAGPASGVGLVEGWRGTIAHRVEACAGALTRLKIVDPSFMTWPALPVALAETIVPDFPLTNKSFNLSYAGNDL